MTNKNCILYMVSEVGHISITSKAADKIASLRHEGNLGEEYFIRVSVKGGGCSGLSYNLDFDNELKPGDQEFINDGVKVICEGLLGTNIRSELFPS